MLFESIFNYTGFSINAATDDDGKLWVNQKTIAEILEKDRFSFADFSKGKKVKALLPEGFRLQKISDNTNLQNSKQTWVDVPSFLFIINFYQEKSKRAKAIVFAGFTVDFLASLKHHFGEAFDEEEKEYVRKLIFDRLAAFKSWTDFIRDRHLELYKIKPSRDYYKECVKTVNRELFGVTHFYNNRTENMSQLQQETIKEFEQLLVKMGKKYPIYDPKAVIRETLKVWHMIH